ncbi:DUF5079 family protein [Staphylococcus hyicus]|uniref:DUF5079 family protein n=1 Tax=Staphylococcus hyicus TaxID=1284 RepID=UPI00208E958A|nr:DUF5079 family protein [Staphylococcus hyicus]MCO4329319.1 DUF5079 family protein [Staphylococcus hyicus]MCO4335247.1 DUF5079 family protein [Staphylococcus hyicus]
MLETYITNLKKSHMKPFVVLLMIIIAFFSISTLYVTKTWADLPIYIYTILVIWFLSCIVIFKQDSFKNVKIGRSAALRYLLVNVFVGYMQIITFSSLYVIEMTRTHGNVTDDWLGVVLAILLSLIGLVLFCLNEFHIIVNEARRWLNVLAIFLKIVSLGMILYFNFKVPVTSDENMYIWLLIVLIICIDALLIRSFLNYALFMDELRNGPYKMESHQSNVQ